MKLALYKGKGTIYDKIIRIVTRSKYSHCELVIDDVCYSSSPRDGGVRMKVIDLDPDKWDLFDVPGDTNIAITWFINNVGKKYDWPGAITQVLPFHLNLSSRFFCSEACQHMLGVENPKSQTPESLARLYRK